MSRITFLEPMPVLPEEHAAEVITQPGCRSKAQMSHIRHFGRTARRFGRVWQRGPTVSHCVSEVSNLCQKGYLGRRITSHRGLSG